MATVNLAKALKMKNALVTEINRAKVILTRENSRSQRSTSKVEREKVYADIVSKTNELITLKTTIATANVGIYNFLAQMEEAKSAITYLQSLPTTDGLQVELGGRFGTDKTETLFNAFFTQEKVDAEIASIQKIIENLQDKVDAYNATTQVSV